MRTESGSRRSSMLCRRWAIPRRRASSPPNGRTWTCSCGTSWIAITLTFARPRPSYRPGWPARRTARRAARGTRQRCSRFPPAGLRTRHPHGQGREHPLPLHQRSGGDAARGGPLPTGPFGTILNPVRVMEADHARGRRPARPPPHADGRLRPAAGRVHDLQARATRNWRGSSATSIATSTSRTTSCFRARSNSSVASPRRSRVSCGRAACLGGCPGADSAVPAREPGRSRAAHIGRVAA